MMGAFDDLIPGGSGGPQFSAKERAEARTKVIGARNLRAQIDKVQGLYDRDLRGVGPGSILEYLPSQRNSQFDSAVANLRVVGKPFFRVPGEGANSDKDQQLTDESLPNRMIFDSANEQRIGDLRSFVDSVERQYLDASQLQAPAGSAGFKIIGRRPR